MGRMARKKIQVSIEPTEPRAIFSRYVGRIRKIRAFVETESLAVREPFKIDLDWTFAPKDSLPMFCDHRNAATALMRKLGWPIDGWHAGSVRAGFVFVRTTVSFPREPFPKGP